MGLIQLDFWNKFLSIETWGMIYSHLGSSLQEDCRLLWSDDANVLVWTEMEDAHSELIFLTPSWIDSIILYILDADAEATQSERIFLTPSCIDDFILGIF